MIKRITGKVTDILDRSIIISVCGCLGIEVFVSDVLLFTKDSEYTVYTVMTFFPEKGYEIYGFLDEIVLEYFLLLQSIRGISSRLALSILGFLPLDSLYQAIIEEDNTLLNSVNGVGKKKAEIIIFELKSKIKNVPIPMSVKGNCDSNQKDLKDALFAIGYAKKEVDSMLEKVAKKGNSNQLTLIELIQEAIR